MAAYFGLWNVFDDLGWFLSANKLPFSWYQGLVLGAALATNTVLCTSRNFTIILTYWDSWAQNNWLWSKLLFLSLQLFLESWLGFTLFILWYVPHSGLYNLWFPWFVVYLWNQVFITFLENSNLWSSQQIQFDFKMWAKWAIVVQCLRNYINSRYCQCKFPFKTTLVTKVSSDYLECCCPVHFW